MKKAAKKDLGEKERAKLLAYHNEMVHNFQHEQSIHLAVTLFFGGMAVLFSVLSGAMVLGYGLAIEVVPLLILMVILWILEAFYIRHYYFLENHIQGLYKWAEKLSE